MAVLTPLAQQFVLHWGEMGNRWGINRTVAQIHALLYVSEKALNADEICEALDVARSNVSTSLRELQNWGVVKVVHVKSDRRDHFETIKDVFEMFRVIMSERKRREIDPTITILNSCIAEADQAGPSEEYTKKQLQAMREFFEMGAAWFEQVNKMGSGSILRAMKLGDKVFKLLGN
jgi:DNA-binding transcriptional regulator GbsR (MarR family)